MIQNHLTKGGAKRLRNFRGLFLLTATLIFCSCATVHGVKDDFAKIGQVSRTYVKQNNTEYLLYIIPLECVETICWVPVTDGYQRTQNFTKFAKESGSFLVINTVPYKTRSKNPFGAQKPISLIIENEQIVCPANDRYGAIRFFYEDDFLKCKIYDDQSSVPVTGTLYACGGYWTILDGNEIRQFKDIKNNRTAVGTAQDGTVLYILCGKNLSYMDCAKIFKEAGAQKAFEFDGGHSVILLENAKTLFKAKPFIKPPVALGLKMRG